MKLLICYQSFPEPDTNAGGARLYEIVRILRESGVCITFLARTANDSKYRAALERLGVICHADKELGLRTSTSRFRDFLRSADFDAAVLVHYYIYNVYADLIRAFLPRCRLVLDTVDIHHLRLQRAAELSGAPADRERWLKARTEELRAVNHADQVWVVTQQEKKVLSAEGASGDKPFHVIPTIHRVEERPPGFERREGVVFLGGYGHHPNVDAVHFLLNTILPPLRALLPSVPVTIAGSNPPDNFHTYAQADPLVSIAGFVQDHRAVLCAHRIGIAPLRFGAGMKGKIGEYMACGLPCVTTSVGAEGMNLTSGREVLIADDPADFAAAVARLYTDAELWSAVSAAGMEYVQRTVAPLAIARRVVEAVQACSAAPRPGALKGPMRVCAKILNPFGVAGKVFSVFDALKSGGVRELGARWKLWLTRT